MSTAKTWQRNGLGVRTATVADLGARLGAALAQATMRLAVTAWTWRERRRGRLALGRLDDRLLADIGVSRASAGTESEKPFWRA